MSVLAIGERFEMGATARRIGVLACALAVWACSAAAVAGKATAGPVLEVSGFHSPTSFQPDSAASYSFWVSNVGDEAVDQQRNDNGTPDDTSDDTFGAPVTIDVDLPPGVVTRQDGLLWPIFGESVDVLTNSFPRWSCDSSDAGLGSVSCRLAEDRIAPGHTMQLTVRVTPPASSSGTLDATATVGGGGAAAVSHVEAAPMGPRPGFGLTSGSFEADAFGASGQPARQAGAHPLRASTVLDFNVEGLEGRDLFGDPKPVVMPVGSLRNLDLRFPRGFVGDPTAATACKAIDFLTVVGGGYADGTACPEGSQVGIVNLTVSPLIVSNPPPTVNAPLYRTAARRGALAQFSFQFMGHAAHITAHLDPTDYSVVTRVRYADDVVPVHRIRATLWGVPADPVHDGSRYDPGRIDYGAPSPLPLKPLLTLPSECGVADSTVLSRMDSWQNPGVFVDPVSSEPAAAVGCGDPRMKFKPEIEIQPTTVEPDAPSGLEVDLKLPPTSTEFSNVDALSEAVAKKRNAKKLYPESGDPAAIATPPLRKAVVRLPEGMSINPAAADGLQACSDDQLRLGTDLGLQDGEPTCPEGSKVGSVRVVSPALEDPVEGGVFIRSQNSMDPGSGEMFRLALVVKDVERGVNVKLPGSVKADPATGRLVTTFDENPQLPVERIELSLKGGPRAPLAMPSSCGVKTTEIELTSWAGHVVDSESSFTIPCPAGQRFAPDFDAGSVNPTGGAFSPFVVLIDRREGDQFLSGVRVDMPKGLVAKLKGVQLCPDQVAGDGTPGVCPEGSRIGTATVGAGSGSPFRLQGPVYLTGPYRGAPYGLSVQVAAKAGPFDLGMVKVRNALHVDPVTARVSVVSDALPQVVKGVPVRLRTIDVNVDRPRFAINPTSCSQKQIDATLTSVNGAVSKHSKRFQVGDCRSLAFKPKLAMRLSGRKQTRTGGHPGLKAVVSQKRGQANIARAKVTLPSSIALDAANSYDPKLVCDYDRALRADCPASSVIGRANAVTPLLNRPLAGDVHLVQGIKLGKRGNRIRTLPTLLVKLRGEVAIDLRAKTSTEKKTNRLVTTFPTVPDAPVSKFAISINGGSKGILVVTRTAKRRLNLCTAKQIASVETDGHNGRRADFATTVKTPCATKPKRANAKRKPAADKRRT